LLQVDLGVKFNVLNEYES